ncbi:unnamed protein product [Clonostachys solani]|uniref:F-box domain-containing protein n=1 Tax=Clonostachys solani TaxID=160281 RepID=A0A9N9W0F3_9HYPO|nr:unnamed protein product [Clonostachys solani]
MDSTPDLTSLPVEILQLILEHTHTSGHWPLAQTCKHVYLHSQHVLNRHREAYQKFRISSDLDPRTIIHLLASCFSHGAASIDAWHVREFEVWGDRENGEPWEVDVDTGEVRIPEGGKPWLFPRDGISYFCDELLKAVGHSIDKEGFQAQARKQLETGADSHLKCCLLALLPRIRALRYARAGGADHKSFKYLCRMIHWCMSETLLPGFKTLEKVSFGICLGQTADGQPEPSKRSAGELYALLCLPNLSELYFAHLDGEFELDDGIAPCFLFGRRPPFSRSSPVRTIILDMMDSLGDELIEFVAKTPRGLENLAIRLCNESGLGDERHQLTEELLKYQRLSLQRLCWYNADSSAGSTVPNWMDPSHVIMFDDLRVVSLDLLYVEGLPPDARSKAMNKFGEFLVHNLSAQMEVADFDGVDFWEDSFTTAQLSHIKLDYLDDMVEAMVRSKRYEKLKAVFLGEIQDLVSGMQRTLFHFPKTNKAAKERGIYLHLKGSKPPPGLIINGEFVPIPTRDCMVTAVFSPGNRERSRPTTFKQLHGTAGLDGPGIGTILQGEGSLKNTQNHRDI